MASSCVVNNEMVAEVLGVKVDEGVEEVVIVSKEGEGGSNDKGVVRVIRVSTIGSSEVRGSEARGRIPKGSRLKLSDR